MRCLVLLLAVVAVHGAPRGGKTPEARACHEALMTPEERDAKKATMDACIAEQDGLATIVETLRPEPPSDGGPGSERGDGGERSGPGGRRGGGNGGKRGGPKGPGGPGGIVAQLVEAGNTAEADTLKRCLARENGHITTDGTDAFDVTKFKDEILANVADFENQANVQLGIDNCPEDSLTNFDVPIFMKCVMSYCATGEAPPTE